MSKTSIFIAGCAAGVCSLSTIVTAGSLTLPPEVTPELRAACEADVRRLCIDANPTVAKVKRCVARKFHKLGVRCQVKITMAGFRP